MVSISDVARRAGVSPTTVSHTLSGKRKVSEQVRNRVYESMRELNFVPTRAAQNLALGRTSVIALVVPDIAIEYFAELAKSIEGEVFDRGYNVMLATTGFDAEREARYLEMVASRAVDGIIFASGTALGARTRDALTGGLPLVLVDEEIDGLDLPTIVSDNEAGGRLAAEHLAGLGHRSVLEIEGEHAAVTSRLRSEGFRAAWGAERTIVAATGDYSAESGRAAVREHLASFVDGTFTAVFAHNDLMALGVIDALRSEGVRVPEDVSVVGFDDASPASLSYPGLTTIRQDVRQLGGLAATRLLDALAAGEPLPSVRTLVPVELIVRNSTSEAKA